MTLHNIQENIIPKSAMECFHAMSWVKAHIIDLMSLTRPMGFQNEKDHPEVAPNQFEINYGYAEAVAAVDQIQLYKLLTCQIAANMVYTACFLPKPVVGVNGSGMYTNASVSQGKTDLFWDEKGEEQLSTFGWSFLDRILTRASWTCASSSIPASTPIAAWTRTSRRPTRFAPRPPTVAPWFACLSATRAPCALKSALSPRTPTPT